MTTLYRPVLIESAAQAEALPVGTIALDHPTGNADRLPYVKATATRWASVWGVDDLGAIDAYGTAPNEAMVGDSALVPIEAEEETREHPRRHEKAPRAGEAYLRPATMTRLVTPWEEA